MNFDGWIGLDEWCKKYDERRDTVHARVSTGRWERGVVFAAPDGGSCFVHEERAKAWLKEKGLLKHPM